MRKLTIVTLLLASALSAAPLPNCTGTTVTGCVQNRSGWPQAYGGPYDVYLQAAPTSLTQVDAKTSHVLGICVTNTTGGALTFTFQTGDGTPLAIPPSGSIPANTSVCSNTPWGLLVNAGFSVQGASGLLWQATWTH